MKKTIFFGILLCLCAYCFAQELVITRIESNYSFQWGGQTNQGSWPAGDSGRQWNAVMERYNLVRLWNSDPFVPPDPLIEQIGRLSIQRAGQGSGTINFIDPSTVYLTMGDRRFICFLYRLWGSNYYWVYEVM